MTLQDVETVSWVQMGAFAAMTIVLGFLGYGVKTPAKRLKMLAIGVGFFVMMIASTSMAKGQGFKTRSDGIAVSYERYIAQTLYLPFGVLAIGLSLDEWWGKAATLFATQGFVSALLIFGGISTEDPRWISFIYSCIVLGFEVLFMCVFLVTPASSNVTNTWRWITIGMTSLGLVVYQVFYMLDSTWLNIFKAFEAVGPALYLVLNVAFGIWLLVVFRMIDLHEDNGGLGSGLPIVSGGQQKECKAPISNSRYSSLPSVQNSNSGMDI